MTSRIVSPMSHRSPSVSVIGSLSSLEALVFFCGPTHSISRDRFNCVEGMLGSVPFAVSSVPCPMVKSRPPSSHVMVAPVSYVVAACLAPLVYFAMVFTALQKALTSSANSSLHFY